MIIIRKPTIEKEGEGFSRCCCEIEDDGIKKNVWFEVPEEYEKYLVTERADAYVIGLLHYAMSNKKDIVCDIPVTDELLYNITTILIPTLTKHQSNMHKIKVTAEVDSSLGGGKAIGTGCSCGVDSFDAIYMHYRTEYKSLDLTHLCINNVGAFNHCYHEYGAEKVKDERYSKSEQVAEELELPLIKTDSNFMESFPQDHLVTSTYSNIFAVYMLQKFWKIYYLGSAGTDYSEFDVFDSVSAHYELLSLQCFSISGLKIYSEGGEKTRLEKTKDIINFNPSHHYLHVCYLKPYNCNVCNKCKRTLLTLDLLDVLDDYSDVFDISYYKAHRGKYYAWLASVHSCGDKDNEPVYQGMLKRKEFAKYAKFEIVKKPIRNIRNWVIRGGE